MKKRMYGGLGAMLIALAVVGGDAFTTLQAQAAETKVDPKIQECAKVDRSDIEYLGIFDHADNLYSICRSVGV